MTTTATARSDRFDLSFKVFHDLMAKKVSDILLVSSPYDAFIMEEDGRLAGRIIREYRGLNLSRPPKLTWVSTAQEALQIIQKKRFDFVVTMPRLDDMNPYALGRKIKQDYPDLPVFLLSHSTGNLHLEKKYYDSEAIDRVFVWSGDTDLLLAIIKNVEDWMNVAFDTQSARVRVIILVEDSPVYYSSLLPMLYKEIVVQTQAVMEDSLNEEHRMLRMRARPKILIAENFEDALDLYKRYKPYLLCLISDVRFPRNGKMDPDAGFQLLSTIKQDSPDAPLLLFSSEESNRKKALQIPAVFLNKNSASLHTEIRSFFVQYLGFGEFIFHLPDGTEVARASNLRTMEQILASVPEASIFFHATRNHFSSWLMARSEIQLASQLRPIKATDFPNVQEIKNYLVSCIRERRTGRQKGVIADFIPEDFDPETEFVKLGKGSLGGKARGLAFVTTLLKQQPEFQESFPDINIGVPRSLVISTEGFDAFIADNKLKDLAMDELSDFQIAKIFLEAQFPPWLKRDLEIYLSHISYPLAIRSSSLLEDAQYQPFAGIYNTYMISNQHPDINVRLSALIQAIKLVYASIYMETPRSFAKMTLHRTEEEKMAVVLQQLTGARQGRYFYPAISGVAQSYNFYPISYMKPEEGIAHISLGLGKTIVEGGQALRFSPKYPQILPQFSTVEDILKNSQRSLYALKMDGYEPTAQGSTETAGVVPLSIEHCSDHSPVRLLSSTYFPEDHRIRDTFQNSGQPVVTFASVLKYKSFPLPEILTHILTMGRKGMGCAVEIEFAVNLPSEPGQKPEFAILQIRPMALRQHHMDVDIRQNEITRAFCFSKRAMGNGLLDNISDVVFVKPDEFDPAHTIDMVGEISSINRTLNGANRKYLLIGPGRWGSADRWLGIPVNWNDISGVKVIIETSTAQLRADPSQGSHFFHNITSLGISYITVTQEEDEFIDWPWLTSLPAETETRFIKHVKLEKPISIMIDGRNSCAALVKP